MDNGLKGLVIIIGGMSLFFWGLWSWEGCHNAKLADSAAVKAAIATKNQKLAAEGFTLQPAVFQSHHFGAAWRKPVEGGQFLYIAVVGFAKPPRDLSWDEIREIHPDLGGTILIEDGHVKAQPSF
jgi:hypothetical protein